MLGWVRAKHFALIDFIFGKSFWSTVIRSAVLIPLLGVLSLPFVFVFGAAEEVVGLRSFSAPMWIITSVWGMLFGSWFGWGFAYWRFEERPVKPGMFAKYPLVTGLYYGIAFWVFVGELSRIDPEIADDRIAATIFGLIVGPPMALFMSAFWRYALQFTALSK